MTAVSEAAFERHRAQVYSWAYRLLQNHHDALDVVQEVLVKWWQAKLKGDAPANPIGWLRRVTVNLAIDAIRSAARKPEVRLARTAADATKTCPTAGATDEPTQRETAERIAAALAALTDRQRAVVVAKVYDGCTFAQIAEQMALSLPTVKTHYLRALQTLRHKLRADRPTVPRGTEPTAAKVPHSGTPGDNHEL